MVKAAPPGAEDICSDDWRLRLEELQRLHPPAPRVRAPGLPPDEAELTALARRAVRDSTEANWKELTFPSKPYRTRDIAVVVRQLNGPEAVAVLSSCASRYRHHPRERPLCAVWILQIIENRGSILVGRRETAESLRDLLEFFKPYLGKQPLTTQVSSCQGKWHLALNLAQRHRRSRASAQAVAAVTSRAPASGNAGGAAAGAAEEDEASSEEDEDASSDAGNGSDDE